MVWLAQALLSLPVGADASLVDFRTEVLPILKARCVECHRDPAANSGKRPKGGLRLDGKHWILEGTRSGPVVVPGDPTESLLYELIRAGEGPPTFKLRSRRLIRRSALIDWLRRVEEAQATGVVGS